LLLVDTLPDSRDEATMLIWLWLAVGLAVLTAGAELLVRGGPS